MDVIINLVISFFVIVALVVTARYLKRVNVTYGDLIKSLLCATEDLNTLYESTNSRNLEVQCSEIFEKYPNLEPTWDNYRRRLNDDKTYALIHSREFFSRDKLINLNIKNRDRIKALPGLLTAWGLLGTFVAILLGLTGIDPNNIATINHLVHGLYAKFASSIVALGCSIFFVFQERGIYSEINVACNKFQQAMEDIFTTKSTNEILASMEANLGKNIAENSLASIEKMVTLFRENLTQGTMEQFQSMKNTILNLENLMKEIYESHDTYLDKLDRLNSVTENTIDRQIEFVDNFNEILDSVKSVVKQFNKAIKDSNELINNIVGTTSQIADINEQFSTILPKFENNNNSIDSLTDNLKKSVQYFEDIAKQIYDLKLDEVTVSFKNEIKESLNSLKEELLEDMKIVKDDCNWYNMQVNGFVDNAASNLKQITSSMNEYSSITNDFLSGYDKSMTSGVNYLNNVINSMDKSFKNNIEQLNSRLEEFNKVLKTIDLSSNSEE